MDELEALRQKRTHEIQQRIAESQAEQDVAQEMTSQKDAVLKQVLTPDAKSRLATLKMHSAKLAEQVENLILYIAQTKPGARIDDATLRQLLEKISARKPDSKITIQRK